MEKFLVGLWSGVLISCLLVAFFPGKNFEDMQKAIKDCEASLPRDQHCIVRAEPILKGVKE